MRAAKLQKRAARYGVQTESVADTVAAAAAAVETAPDKARAEQAMGQLLFAAAALARNAGIDRSRPCRNATLRLPQRTPTTQKAKK
mgnify:CR=1 FL=1